MTKLFLKLDKVIDVKNFIITTSKIPWNVYLQRGEYIVDAKSIMGIFSLDLTKPLCFISEQELPEEIYNELKIFTI